jgi:trehalose-phosphatase
VIDPQTFLEWLVRAEDGCVLALDYDGTLTPIQWRPDLAAPDVDLRKILSDLTRIEPVHLVIVSGRDVSVLERWLPLPELTLVGGHGAEWRPPFGRTRKLLAPDGARQIVLQAGIAARREFAGIPGAEIEEKAGSIAAHYRRVSPDHRGEWFSRWHALCGRFSDRLVRKSGKCVEELCWPGIDKGAALREVLRQLGFERLPVLAVGDDRTDELMFELLGPEHLTVHVGEGPTAAAFQLKTVSDVRQLLRSIEENWRKKELKSWEK